MRFIRDESPENLARAIRSYTPDEIERGYRITAYGPGDSGRKDSSAVPTDIQILYELRQLRAEVAELRARFEDEFRFPDRKL
jgi:hypothetical protein